MVILSGAISVLSKKSEIENKIGFRLEGFKKRDLNDALKSLSEIGYSGIELCLEHPDLYPENHARHPINKIDDSLAENNLEISAVSFHGKQLDWEDKTQICRYGIELCQKLDAKVFITGSHISPKSFAEMVKFTRDLSMFSSDVGVYFAVEPEPGTVIAGTKEMNSLFNEINNPILKINYDIGHSFITENNLYDDILYWNDRIVHTHIEDIKGSIHRHLIPGEGDINFKDVFKAFGKIDYRGYYTIDLFDIEDNSESFAKNGFLQIKRIIDAIEQSRRY